MLSELIFFSLIVDCPMFSFLLPLPLFPQLRPGPTAKPVTTRPLEPYLPSNLLSRREPFSPQTVKIRGF